MSTDTAISVCMQPTRDEYTCSRPAGHRGRCFAVSDPLDDQRTFVHVTDAVLHVRVPHADHRNGRTIAYASRLPSGQWRARLTLASIRLRGAVATVAEHDSRAAAEEWLRAATDWARRPAL